MLDEIQELYEKEMYEECVNKCIVSLPILEKNPNYWGIFSAALTFSRRYKESIYSLQRLENLYSNLNKDELLFCLSYSLLIIGEWKLGFAAYEHRIPFWKSAPYIHSCKKNTRWQGEDISGKTLLVHHDGGIGDCIQFLRYIPYLKRLKCKLILFLRNEINCLFKHLDVEFASQNYHDYDAFVFLMSLPFCFGTEIATTPPPVRIECSRHPVKGRIGIVWKTGAKNSDVGFGKKNSDLNQWINLFTIPDVHYVCLQKEVTAKESLILSEYHIDRPPIRFFTDTVKILETCERVICVDTAVLHLAASMHIPTSVLLPFNACWRWLAERDDSPWYSSVKLFRQRKINQWTDPIQDVEASIRTPFESIA